MKKITLFAAAIALVSSLAACSGAKDNAAAADDNANVAVTDTIAEPQGVINLKDDNQFRPDAAVDRITVLDFNATWCVPCKKLTPAYHQVAAEMPDVAFYSVDIDSLPATKEAFNVTEVPTVVILAPGAEMQVYTSLNDFKKDVELPDSATLTDTIAANLAKYIGLVK